MAKALQVFDCLVSRILRSVTKQQAMSSPILLTCLEICGVGIDGKKSSLLRVIPVERNLWTLDDCVLELSKMRLPLVKSRGRVIAQP